VQPQSSSSAGKLVDFEAPPVSEVVLSVQFATPAVDIAALAAFTTAVREAAPAISHQQVLPRMEETFDKPFFAPAFQIIEQMASLPGTWFAGPDGYLIQLQPDRLTLNWRREPNGAPYPGYAAIRSRFDSHLAALRDAVQGTGHQIPAIDICEVTYVNPIEIPGPHQAFRHPDLGRLINRLCAAPPDGFLGDPEDAQYQARWRIQHPHVPDQAIGRLYLAASPHVAGDMQTPLYLVNLTAHVLPDKESTFDALNVAREYVVLGFKDLTTRDMHDHWQLKENS
jgi:uncharacterized protein (TIGR04255 family)